MIFKSMCSNWLWPIYIGTVVSVLFFFFTDQSNIRSWVFSFSFQVLFCLFCCSIYHS